MRENLSWWFANNKGAGQPAHLRGLISAFAIALLESIISKLTTSEISRFQLVSVAEQVGLSITVRNPKDIFCPVEAHMSQIMRAWQLMHMQAVNAQTSLSKGCRLIRAFTAHTQKEEIKMKA